MQVFLDAGIPAPEVARLGALAADYGVETLWASSFPARREPLLCLSALAMQPGEMRLGAVPLSPYEQHPLKLADGLLTLNELSGGRVSVTIGGLGHSVMRVTGLSPVRRVRAVKECVELLRAAASGKPVDYVGELYTLQNYHADWLTQLPPRIYVGANGPQMLRMAGEVADGVMLSDVPRARMAEVMKELGTGRERGALRAADLKLTNFFAWHIQDDAAAAQAEARMELVWRGLLQPWHTEPFLGVEEAARVDAQRDAFLQAFLARSPEIAGVDPQVVQALVDNLTFTGGPEAIPEVVRELEQFAAAGLDAVTLKIHGDAAAAIRLIGTRLIPALPSAG